MNIEKIPIVVSACEELVGLLAHKWIGTWVAETKIGVTRGQIIKIQEKIRFYYLRGRRKKKSRMKKKKKRKTRKTSNPA